MALSQRLDLRQTQALVMTPQLQQAIKLLQLSNLELSLYVEGELEQRVLPARGVGGELARRFRLEGAGAERAGPPDTEPTVAAPAPDTPLRDAADHAAT